MSKKKNEDELIKEVKEKLSVFNDDKFIFEEEEHIYTYEGKRFISVTTFIENFIDVFDEEYWSKKKADERGVDQEVVLNEWAVTRDRACDLGTMVHEYIEDFYNGVELKDYNDEEVDERVNKFHEIYEKRLKPLKPIISELRLFDTEWCIAGTLDQLYLYKGMLIIGDWKTNKKIKTDKDWSFNMLKYPFQRYKDNEINKYSIQISLYALILKRVTGLDISYGFICHIPPKGPAEIYKLKDFKKELEMYINGLSKKEKEIINKTPQSTNIW